MSLAALPFEDHELVRIRERVASDALDEYRWRRDTELAKFDASEPLTMPFSDYLRHFEREITTVDPTRHAFALEAPDGRHIGTIMYYNGTNSGAAEFGISVAEPSYRDVGVGAAATTTFLRGLWDTERIRVVTLHTLEWNERAVRCFQRSGFEPAARVFRKQNWFLRMEARREWWRMWDLEGRFVRNPLTGDARNG
jgi:RimJ/RimL family protein N-acetyltransferase